jgi:hypothetical protein
MGDSWWDTEVYTSLSFFSRSRSLPLSHSCSDRCALNAETRRPAHPVGAARKSGPDDADAIRHAELAYREIRVLKFLKVGSHVIRIFFI